MTDVSTREGDRPADGEIASSVDAPRHENQAVLADVRRLYDAGQYVDAYRLAQPLGDPRTWPDLEGSLLGARLLSQVGGGRLSEAIMIRLHRANPLDPAAALFYAYVLSSNRGPWAAWRFLESRGEPPRDAPVRIRSDWLAMRAGILSTLRDFTAADLEMGRALELTPDRSWTHVEHAEVLEAEDRYDESLAAAQRALELRPWFLPAVRATAKTLTLLDRVDEAIDLLEQAAEHVQSFSIHWHVSALWRERRDYRREDRAIARAAELLLVEDKSLQKALTARRSDIAYAAGDITRCVELARAAGDPFFKTIADRLERPAQERSDGRVILDLPFVRQHHLTCAPATLTAIARYWRRPADHLDIAEQICYDGTLWHSEREWAESNGYIAVEFRATLDVAAALLDRGIPFTLATVAATSAHLQAVVGYDLARGSLLIRDPYVPFFCEMLDKGLPDPTGLRALAIVPSELADRLEGIELPDAALYDSYHALNTALMRHDRAAAADHVAALQRDHPDHALTLLGRGALAQYDADHVTQLVCIDALLKAWPGNRPLLMRRFGLLMRLERRRDAIAHLERIVADPEVDDPAFRERLADLLSQDARNNPRVRSILRPLLALQPRSASVYWTLAGVLWSDERARPQARDAYRFAATLEDRDERYAWSYFITERMAGNAAAALQTLHDRAERFGAKSSGPAITLFHSLRRLGHNGQALEVIHQAIQRRPDDAELLLLAAVEHACRGDHARAASLLDQARPFAREAACRRVEAIVHEERAELEAALEAWKGVADAEPLNIEAADRIAHLLAALRGPRQAVRHLAALCKRFPFHIQLHEMLYQRLRELEDPRADKLLRRLLDLHPANAWALREIGFRAIRRADLDKARDCLERAQAVDPRAPATCYLRAEIAERQGDLAAARAAYRKAVALDSDNPHGLSQLLRLCDSPDRALRNVRFIVAQLQRQPGVGAGLLQLQRQSVGLAPPEEILAELADLHRQREDVWQAWAALIDQHIQMKQLPDALALAQRAVKQFPHVPALFHTLASVHRARLERADQAAALREALRLDPSYEIALHDLASCLVDEARFDDAVSLLDDALRREPRNTAFHAHRALTLWQAGRREEAMHGAERAIDLDPEHEWMWDRYDEWCEAAGQADRAVTLARRLVEARPRNPRLWINLARRLITRRRVASAPDAARRAIQLDPHDSEAHDVLATALSMLHRHTDALQACSPAVFGSNIPIALRGRAAWVEAQRGDYPAAIQRIRAALDDAPGYEWGWDRLAEWARQTADYPSMRQACERLAELSPHNPGAMARAGHALETEAREAGHDAADLLDRARDYYRRAFALDVSYTGCGRALLHLLLEAASLREADDVLERLAPHLQPAMLLSCRLQRSAVAHDAQAVSALLAQLITTPGDDEDAFDNAVTAMKDHLPARDRRRLLRQYTTALRSREANPLAAAALLRWHILRRDAIEVRRLLRKLRKTDACWTAAATAYMFHAFSTPTEHTPASSFLRRHRRRIRRAPGEQGERLRGAACSLAAHVQQYQLAVWLTRNMAAEAAAPLDGMWTLLGVVCSLHAVRRYDDARELADRALQAPPDNSYPRWLIWRAISAVRDRDPALARRLLAQVHPGPLVPLYKFLHACASAVAVASDASAAAELGHPDVAGEPHAPSRILQQARAGWIWWRRDRLMARCHALAKRRIDEHRGGLPRRIATVREAFDRRGMDLGLGRFAELINFRSS